MNGGDLICWEFSTPPGVLEYQYGLEFWLSLSCVMLIADGDDAVCNAKKSHK
jgi:hypothetical protein